MKTYLITKEQVQAYLLDYWTVLEKSAEKNSESLQDMRWVLLGDSGRALFLNLQDSLRTRGIVADLIPVLARYDREKKEVNLWTADELREIKRKKEENDPSPITRAYTREALEGKKVIIFSSS